MNTPNPLHPQGAFPDSRGRSHVRIAVFTILAIHVVLLGALLLQGCKRTTNDTASDGDLGGTLPPFTPATNAFAPPPDIMTFAPPPPPPATSVVEIPPVTPPPVTEFVPPPSEITPPPPTEVMPPPPKEIAPPPVAPREHEVAKGDSFWSLGQKYGVSMKAIADANPNVDSRRLQPGQKLKIPPPEAKPKTPAAATGGTDASGRTVYVVVSGDNLTKIALKFGTSVKALRSENNLPTDRLKVGQKLKIPASATKDSGKKDAGKKSAPKTATKTATGPRGLMLPLPGNL